MKLKTYFFEIVNNTLREDSMDQHDQEVIELLAVLFTLG